MRSYILMWKNGLSFTGRTRRRNFWIASLISYIIILILSFGAEQSLAADVLIKIYSVAFIVPEIAMIIRRLHDSNHSGGFFFFIFIPVIGWIILLIYLILDGTSGENRFGQDPRIFDIKV